MLEFGVYKVLKGCIRNFEEKKENNELLEWREIWKFS